MNTVLMYHYIGHAPRSAGSHRGLYVPPKEFRRQLAAIGSMSLHTPTPEEFDEALRGGEDKRLAWLTFDDGARDNYTDAFPLLREAGLRATFFVIVDRCLRGDEGYMNLAMMREMIDAGMSIGSHTLTHPKLARVSEEQLRAEVIDSKRKLEDALGIEVTSFCYPYGNWNQAVVDTVLEAGYRVAASTIRDNVNSEEDRYLLRRAMIQPGRTGLRFRYLFSPLYHWVHERKNRGRWMAR